MPFDFKKYDAKCAEKGPEELQRDWEHYTRLISGASTSTAVSGLAIPLTLGVSAIGVGMAAPAIHNARKKREIIEKHLQRHGTTHHTRKRDVLGSMALSGTIGVVTLGVGSMGAEHIAQTGAEHGITTIVNNETAIKIGLHAALDGAGMSVEESHHNHKKESAAKKAEKKQQQQKEKEQDLVEKVYAPQEIPQAYAVVQPPPAYSSNTANAAPALDIKSSQPEPYVSSPPPQYTPAPPQYQSPSSNTPTMSPQHYAPGPAQSPYPGSPATALPPYSPDAHQSPPVVSPYIPPNTPVLPNTSQQGSFPQVQPSVSSAFSLPGTPAPSAHPEVPQLHQPQTATQHLPPFTAYVAAPGFNPPIPSFSTPAPPEGQVREQPQQQQHQHQQQPQYHHQQHPHQHQHQHTQHQPTQFTHGQQGSFSSYSAEPQAAQAQAAHLVPSPPPLQQSQSQIYFPPPPTQHSARPQPQPLQHRESVPQTPQTPYFPPPPTSASMPHTPAHQPYQQPPMRQPFPPPPQSPQKQITPYQPLAPYTMPPPPPVELPSANNHSPYPQQPNIMTPPPEHLNAATTGNPYFALPPPVQQSQGQGYYAAPLPTPAPTPGQEKPPLNWPQPYQGTATY